MFYIFSFASLSSIYLLQQDAYLIFSLIYWVVYILPARFWVLHIVHQSFYQMCFFRYFLPVCDLSFHSLKSVFPRAKVFYFNEVQVFFCFFIVLLVLYINLRAFFFPVASKSLFVCCVLHLWKMQNAKSIIYFFGIRYNDCVYIYDLSCIYIWSIIYWKNYPFSIELHLLPGQRSAGNISTGLFMGSIFCFIYLSVHSFANTTVSWLT